MLYSTTPYTIKFHCILALMQSYIQTLKENRYQLLHSITVIGLVASIFLSHAAWSTDRTYPLSPLVAGISAPGYVHTGLLLLTILSLVYSLFSTRLCPLLLTLGTGALSILVLLDITRLQPWVFHYVAILLLFSLAVPRHYTETRVLDAARIVLAGIYFWSGVQKLNARFFSEIFPWFTEKLWLPFGNTGLSVALFVGLLVPFIEALFALGFLTKRFRTGALVGAACMLVLVLASIGPTGHNWNSSVWPWNIAIFGTAVTLFWGLETTFVAFIIRQRHNVLAWVMGFVFWLLPLGNFVGLTDNYLSWSLYSGKVPEAAILGNQEFLQTISPTAADDELRFIRWSMNDLNLVPYPEKRVFISLFDSVCQTYPDEPLTLKIESNFGGNSNFNHQRSYSCNE